MVLVLRPVALSVIDVSKYDNAPWRDAQILRRLYHSEGMDSYEVADELSCSQSAVLKWMDRFGIERRDAACEKGKTSISVDEQGYERIWDGNEYVRLHRLLAAVDCPLSELRGKDIHHENDIPWDNRPENITVLDHETHSVITNTKH